MLKESQVYNYWDIVYSCFVPHEMLSEYRMPVHVLIYVYSGEMLVYDNGRTLKVGEGNYVFIKRDHQVKLLKHTVGDAPYKAISIRFERNFLRDFFGTLDKATLPKEVKRIRESALLLHQTPALQSLFLSLFRCPRQTERRDYPLEDAGGPLLSAGHGYAFLSYVVRLQRIVED